MNIKIIRKILLVAIIAVCVIIFNFSSENSNKSTNTSDGLIDIILETHPALKNLNEIQKQHFKAMLTKPIRKIAHFSIYAILGILLMNYANTYDINIVKKVFISLIIGFAYACSDELHQIFVPGRSGQFTDCLIDTLGIFAGIMLVMVQIKIVNSIINFNERLNLVGKI